MSDRGRLHQNKLEVFAAWLENKGWSRVETKGYYEVLRMVRPKSATPKGESSILLVHDRAHETTHYTLHGESSYWFSKWMKERRKTAA